MAEMRVRKEVQRGIQTIQYQIQTLLTTNGQTPFVSVFMYLDEVEPGQTRDDLALIIAETLKQRHEGIKNEVGVWVSPAFPKLIYVLDEDNITEGAPYLPDRAGGQVLSETHGAGLHQRQGDEAAEEGMCTPVTAGHFDTRP